jgi:hypothetical protein
MERRVDLRKLRSKLDLKSEKIDLDDLGPRSERGYDHISQSREQHLRLGARGSVIYR